MTSKACLTLTQGLQLWKNKVQKTSRLWNSISKINSI